MSIKYRNMNKSSKMRTTYSQFHVLVDYMEKNGDISKFRSNPVGKANLLSHWENLTTLVNLTTSTTTDIGPVRTPDQWRKVWSDFKKNVRKKMARMRKAENGDEKRLLSKLESRVVAIINSSNVNQPNVQGSSEMVDIDDSLETGENKKPKHPLQNSDSDNDDALEDDKAKVKMDYSIQNYTEDYGCNSSQINDDPNNLMQQNEQKYNVTSGLVEIENQINSNTVRNLLEDDAQKRYEEQIIRHCNSNWLPQNGNDYNTLNSWINSIQYKRQKNSSASGWVESNQTQKNEGSMLNNGQNNFDTNTRALVYMDRKGNSAQNDDEKNNGIGMSVVNIRANSSSQSITQVNYGLNLWPATDMANYSEGKRQYKKHKDKGTRALMENNGPDYFVLKEKIDPDYDLNISSSNKVLENVGKITKAKKEMVRINGANSFTKINMQMNNNAFNGVQKDSQRNNDASSSTQINEPSTEVITDGVDNHNSFQNYAINAANRRKSEQITPPVVKRRRRTRYTFIDEEREQRRREQELELMRLEIQREELKLKTKRLTLIERIVTIAEQFV